MTALYVLAALGYDILRVCIKWLMVNCNGRDDPFIAFAPLRGPGFSNNPYILLLAPEQGGHVAFIASKPHNGKQNDGKSSLMTHNSSLVEDRFWAENRVVEFCKLANDIL